MEDQVEEVKRKTDIVGVVSQYVALKKIGRHHKGLCPFHSEKTPSFMVNEELSLYKCFGCGAGGDVIKFLMEVDGIDFRDALERLADKAGVKLAVYAPDRQGEEKKKLFDLMDLTARYYHWLLVEGKSGEAARKYLEDRKINKKLIEAFNIGYSMDGWENLVNYLVKKKGYDMALLEKAGLVSRRSNGGFFDKFRGRLMFPLQNAGGKIVGFSARVIPGARDDEPKYLNSPETEIYHKGNMLYGFYQAKKTMRDKKRVVLVEGQMDVISSYGAGVSETVGVGGTALTVEQIEMVARLSKKILLSMDADDAGTAAMKRAVDMAEKRGLEIKIVQIDGGKDPDEIARNNPGKWKKMVEEAVDVYEFIMTKALRNNDVRKVDGIKNVIHEVIPFLAKIENDVIREVWVNKLATSIGVDPGVIKSEIVKGSVSKPVSVYSVKNANIKKDTSEKKTVKMAMKIIAGLIASPEYKNKVSEWIKNVSLTDGYGKAIEYILGSKESDPSKVVESAPSELKEIIGEAYMSEADSEVDERMLLSLTVQLLRSILRDKRGEITENLKKPGVSEADEEVLLKELMGLDREESRLLLLLG